MYGCAWAYFSSLLIRLCGGGGGGGGGGVASEKNGGSGNEMEGGPYTCKDSTGMQLESVTSAEVTLPCNVAIRVNSHNSLPIRSTDSRSRNGKS
jgi:hypothetical protein